MQFKKHNHLKHPPFEVIDQVFAFTFLMEWISELKQAFAN